MRQDLARCSNGFGNAKLSKVFRRFPNGNAAAKSYRGDQMPKQFTF